MVSKLRQLEHVPVAGRIQGMPLSSPDRWAVIALSTEKSNLVFISNYENI
jgi:hypothetical protein